MRGFLIAVVGALTGCAVHAAGPSYVRDPQGQPLPTTAILDADSHGTAVYCEGGVRYVIVEPPRPYLAGSYLATRRVTVTDAVALCARIRAADE